MSSDCKVLVFDNWSKGTSYLRPIVKPFLERRLSLLFVHVGSWGNDPGRPMEEELAGIRVRDISFYRTDSIDRVLEIEEPDVVLLQSTRTFAHRAFIRYCAQRHIPTLHLYHGVVTVQFTQDPRGTKKVNKAAYGRFVLRRLSKAARYTFPCYATALWKTSARVSDWLRFCTDGLGLIVGRSPLVAAPDARATRCAVFTEADVNHAMTTYGYRAEEVSVIGNPDLIRFGLSEPLLDSFVASPDDAPRHLMYINTGSLVSGRVFSGEQDFLSHMIYTSEVLSRQGYRLMFKPHRGTSQPLLKEIERSAGVVIVSEQDFVPALRLCHGCISETTTLGLVPALMGLPMLLASYSALRDTKFGEAIKSYPRAAVIEDLGTASVLLSRLAARDDCEAVRQWIACNSGPMPANAMPERLATVIESMARRKSSSSVNSVGSSALERSI